MKDGGAAFPSVIGDVGMTLRDYFAGQALALNTGFMENGNYEVLAAECYVLADAMLAEREKRNGKDNG